MWAPRDPLENAPPLLPPFWIDPLVGNAWPSGLHPGLTKSGTPANVFLMDTWPWLACPGRAGPPHLPGLLLQGITGLFGGGSHAGSRASFYLNMYASIYFPHLHQRWDHFWPSAPRQLPQARRPPTPTSGLRLWVVVAVGRPRCW